MKELFCKDESDWTHADESLEEVVTQYFDDLCESENGVITLYKGEAHMHKASNFTPSIWDDMINRACDEAGEHSDDWAYSLDKEDEKELQKLVDQTVDRFFDERDNQPRFSRIKNDKPVKVRVFGEKSEYPYFERCELIETE